MEKNKTTTNNLYIAYASYGMQTQHTIDVLHHQKVSNEN